MKLSKKTRYGARILIELALRVANEPVQVSKIAASQKIPVKYLEQLLRELKLAGIVESARGSKGGHMLTKDPRSVTLGDVVRLFEGQTDLVDCISFPEKCEMSPECLVRTAWFDATTALYEKLDGITIFDLVETHRKKSSGLPVCPADPDILAD